MSMGEKSRQPGARRRGRRGPWRPRRPRKPPRPRLPGRPRRPPGATRAASTSPATRTFPSRPSSTGSSRTRWTPGGSTPAPACPRCASSAPSSGSTRTPCGPSIGALPRRATWSAATAPAPASRRARRCAGRPGRSTAWSPSCLRTAARAGYSADEVAAAVYAVATERRRPGPRVHVLFVECTATDARRAAETISTTFAGIAEADGALIDHVVERLERHHYDLVATSTFHADETMALVAGRAPVVALMAAPSYGGAARRDRGAACPAARSAWSAPRRGARPTWRTGWPAPGAHAPDRGRGRRRGGPGTRAIATPTCSS